MNRRKQNISRWYLLGLAVVLMAGSLMLAVGTALARYRVENEADILFEPRKAVTTALGTLDDTGSFDPEGPVEWKEETVSVPAEEGGELREKKVYALNFAVSNYIAPDKHQEQDLRVWVRLVGSLDSWNENAAGTVALWDGTILEDGTEQHWLATVTAIPENTALYHTFGAGWVFQFLDEQGQEVSWILEGETLSSRGLGITIDASALTGTSLLQLQVVGQAED